MRVSPLPIAMFEIDVSVDSSVRRAALQDPSAIWDTIVTARGAFPPLVYRTTMALMATNYRVSNVF